MALWDNISKKASAVTEKAVHQARNLTELAKLHGQIAEAEKAVTDSYTEIGKLYVAAHSADYDEGFAGKIAAIAEAEQKIQQLRKQIQDLKGVSVCEKCGAEVAKEAAFCSACGAAMPKEEPIEAEVVTDEAPVEEPEETCPDCAVEPEAEEAPSTEET